MLSPSTTNTLLAEPKDTVNKHIFNPGTHYAFPWWGTTWISKGTPIVGTAWRLAFDMIVEVEYTETAVIAASRQLDDYGVGPSVEEAIQNLLLSLVDFRESLERRVIANAQLSDELSGALQNLRDLLER